MDNARFSQTHFLLPLRGTCEAISELANNV
jgi:hypothetical protein